MACNPPGLRVPEVTRLEVLPGGTQVSGGLAHVGDCICIRVGGEAVGCQERVCRDAS